MNETVINEAIKTIRESLETIQIPTDLKENASIGVDYCNPKEGFKIRIEFQAKQLLK